MHSRKLLLALALALALSGSYAAQPEQSDDAFIHALGIDDGRPVDRKRLARVLFSMTASLQGGKSSVRLLETQIVVPEPSRLAVRSLLRKRFDGYDAALTSLSRSVSRLLDRPESALELYDTVLHAHDACWQFDLHRSLVQGYGLGTDPLAALATREACGRMRTMLFKPKVAALIRDALVEGIYQREKTRELKSEVRALEDLLQDLRRIEGSE